MQILITGGAGYVGYSLVKQLLEDVDEIHSITIYDNLSRKNYSFFTEAKFDNKPVKFIQGDILDGRTLDAALKGIDCVVHLAAKVTTPFADHEAHFYEQINHWGTAQLVSAIEKSDVKKVIYLSSMSVYGTHDTWLDEHTEPAPTSFYGISKLDGEKQLQTLRHSHELYVIRSGNVYGYNPAYRIDAVINRFMFDAHFHRRIQINGSGEQSRSFIHVDKIAAYLAGAVDGKYEPGLYNAVEHNLTVNEIAGYMRSMYPALETIHVSFNLNMRSVKTVIPVKLSEVYPLPVTDIDEALKAFKLRFSF
jgi:UDP-glucose 4-epimerase